jgi:hypothetical protein
LNHFASVEEGIQAPKEAIPSLFLVEQALAIPEEVSLIRADSEAGMGTEEVEIAARTRPQIGRLTYIDRELQGGRLESVFLVLRE